MCLVVPRRVTLDVADVSAGRTHYVGLGKPDVGLPPSVWSDAVRATWFDGAGARRGSGLDPPLVSSCFAAVAVNTLSAASSVVGPTFELDIVWWVSVDSPIKVLTRVGWFGHGCGLFRSRGAHAFTVQAKRQAF